MSTKFIQIIAPMSNLALSEESLNFTLRCIGKIKNKFFLSETTWLIAYRYSVVVPSGGVLRKSYRSGLLGQNLLHLGDNFLLHD